MSTSISRLNHIIAFAGGALTCIVGSGAARPHRDVVPRPPGSLIDIGGQRLHLRCTGKGSPAVVLEAGTGDFSVIWALVQPGASAFTRVCSYDRGGYAWSDPGVRPRTFGQLALELHAALMRAHVRAPYLLVGQSYGGLVVRGFADRYPGEVSGMVLVDAVHEDQRVVYGGEPHRIRDGAIGRSAPDPRVGLDTAMVRVARDSAPRYSNKRLEAPLDRLPAAVQRIWRWAEAQPVYRMAQAAELDWSPEELARMHAKRAIDRASLGQMPLIVLARAHGGYADGMSISADSLEAERRALMADLARLSARGKLIFAEHAGHNIHVEDPALVIRSIREVVEVVRKGP
jgi:pimeloyl-ACP methyl ester carboxylesterase